MFVNFNFSFSDNFDNFPNIIFADHADGVLCKSHEIFCEYYLKKFHDNLNECVPWTEFKFATHLYRRRNKTEKKA